MSGIRLYGEVSVRKIFTINRTSRLPRAVQRIQVPQDDHLMQKDLEEGCVEVSRVCQGCLTCCLVLLTFRR